jgi:hypothetical protein
MKQQMLTNNIGEKMENRHEKKSEEGVELVD